ncbi:MAG TPA: helix-turn-helix transcriptional regulator [Verrucomicrobiales bacterium]|nr:helix-turn-helix transcriptional regulator [Verrucomicrobiales bacterium]
MPAGSSFATELSEALRHVLGEARKSASLTLAEVAARSGLNRQAVAFIERGERRPSIETFSRLSAALGMRPSEALMMAEARLSGTLWKEFLAKPPSPTRKRK